MANKDLSLIVKLVDKASGPLQALQAKIGGLSTEKVASKLEALDKSVGVSRLGSALQGVGSEVMNLGRSIVGVLAGGGIAGVAISSLVAASIKAGDALSKQAEIVGMSVDSFASLGYAVQKTSGLARDEFAGMMRSWNKTLGDVTRESGGFWEAMAGDKGVSYALATQFKSVKSGTEGLILLARAVQKIPDPMRQAALAQAALGEQGIKMLPFLRMGPEAMWKLRNRFFDLAGSQEEYAKRSSDTDDAITDTKVAWEGLKNAAITQIMPAIKQLTEAATDFFVKNRPAIVAWAKEFGDRLPARVANFVAQARQLGGWVSSFVERIGGMRTVLILTAAAITGPLIKSLFTLAAVLLTSKIGLIVTGIAIAGALIYRYWEPLSAFFSSLWARIRGPALAFWEWIKGVFLTYTPYGWVIQNWDVLKPYFVALWEGLKTVFSVWWDFVKGLFGWTPLGIVIANWTPIREFFAGIWPTIRAGLESLWGFIKTVWGYSPLGLLIANWGSVVGFFKGIWAEIVGVFEAAWKRIQPVIEKVQAPFAWVKNKVGGAASWVGNKLGPVSSSVEDIRERGRSSLADAEMRALNPEAYSTPPPKPLTASDLQQLKEALTKIKIELTGAPDGTKTEITGDNPGNVSFDTQPAGAAY
jgi:hypothetical protein